MSAVRPLTPYKPAVNPHDGVNDRDALAHAERYAVIAEEAFAACLFPKATAAAALAQAFAGIATAARTGVA